MLSTNIDHRVISQGNGIYLVPVKPAISKYLKTKHAKGGDVVDVTNTRITGLVFSQHYYAFNECVLRTRLMFTATIPVRLPKQFKKRAVVTPRRLAMLSIGFDLMFHEYFYAFVESQVMAGVNEYAAIRNFLSFLDLSDQEYSEDRAWKRWYRYKKTCLDLSGKITEERLIFESLKNGSKKSA